MRHSIFWKLMLLCLPIVLLADFIVLASAYKVTYDNTINNAKKDARESVDVAAKQFEMIDPGVKSDLEICNNTFDEMCDILNLTYLYAIKPDLKNNTLEYLSIGFGHEASENAKKTRYTGVVVDGIYDEEIKAINGEKDVFRFEQNEFGRTITCYTPVTRHWNKNSMSIEEGEVTFVGAEISVSEVIDEFKSHFYSVSVFVVISTGLIVFLIALIFRSKVSKPVRIMSKRMSEFVSDRNIKFVPLKVKGKDEFAEMSRSFNSMAGEIDNYINDISELNREKSTQEAELNIARDIQIGLLEPPEYRSGSAEIHAIMNPARDVGGDLYDYQVLKNGNICVIIADVSGKGVSAALFMSRAVTLLHQYAEMGMSPGNILREYNNHLAARNPNTMFITTFVGIYNPSTGNFTYANAGHNFPYLLSDELITLDAVHGVAAGILSDEEYEEATVKLNDGETVFLYTDGVTEAMNAEKILFGDDALEAALKECLGGNSKNALKETLGKVERFVNEAPQNDDITVLTLTALNYRRERLRLEAKTENLRRINDVINSLGVPEGLCCQLNIMAEEMFVNICSYAYPNGGGEAEIIIEADSSKVAMTFIDSGTQFDPTKDILNIEDYDADNTIGGLGRFITFEIADEYSYEYSDGKNILKLQKNIPESDGEEEI